MIQLHKVCQSYHLRWRTILLWQQGCEWRNSRPRDYATTATPPEENYNDSWEGSGYDSKNNENETLTVTNAYTETPTEGGH